LAVKEIPLCLEDTCATLFETIGKETGPFLIDTLDKLDSASICFSPQNHGEATYCRKVTKEDGEVHFCSETAESIYNKWRAYQPWPGIFSFFEGKRILFEACGLYTGNKENYEQI